MDIRQYRWRVDNDERMRILTGAILGLGIAAPGYANEIIVRMKNSDTSGVMVFVQASVGDTIHFVVTDMGHNAQPIAGMLPPGVTAANGAMNKDYLLTVSKPGLYGIKCSPHFSFGMVALIKAGAGTAPNAAHVTRSVGSLPPLAQKRMVAMLKNAG